MTANHPTLLIPDAGTAWCRVRDGHPVGLGLYERHYSARPNRDSKIYVGPGGKLVLLTPCQRALFVWRQFINDGGQQGVNCAVFRNEGAGLSSLLILQAERFAWARWPGQRLYTYVNPRKIKPGGNPGYCFKMAGWRPCGTTAKGYIILEKLPA
jgi:hypothetical protein